MQRALIKLVEFPFTVRYQSAGRPRPYKDLTSRALTYYHSELAALRLVYREQEAIASVLQANLPHDSKKMKFLAATATVFAYMLAVVMASPLPEDDAIPCPSSWPKNGGIGPVCIPVKPTTPTPTPTPYKHHHY
ncbi:hypothetical protein NP233_g7444 [Leucocoprinus birnbaumii]|uniref:Uncharacterized protein n=1 Tax=Leucocoprinus birnbaumii TaxID=56174 RepID=A0AAD5VPA3_9AGAR|nr:hypothetical protein NP233_g7444 [Leucocoprinus birnbaumii]